MSVTLASWILVLVGLYLAAGVLFAIVFIWKGIGTIDPAAAAGTKGFKALVFPGLVALWPLLARRWLKGQTSPPEERSPHRSASRTPHVSSSPTEAP